MGGDYTLLFAYTWSVIFTHRICWRKTVSVAAAAAVGRLVYRGGQSVVPPL